MWKVWTAVRVENIRNANQFSQMLSYILRNLRLGVVSICHPPQPPRGNIFSVKTLYMDIYCHTKYVCRFLSGTQLGDKNEKSIFIQVGFVIQF